MIIYNPPDAPLTPQHFVGPSAKLRDQPDNGGVGGVCWRLIDCKGGVHLFIGLASQAVSG